MVEEARELSSLFYESAGSIHKDSTLMTYSPPKGPPLNTITWGVRISANEFRRDTNIQFTAKPLPIVMNCRNGPSK
jgi:hypothetical protein